MSMYAPELRRYGGWPWRQFVTMTGMTAKASDPVGP